MEVPNLLRPSRNVTLWVDRAAGGVWLVLLLVGKSATVAKKKQKQKKRNKISPIVCQCFTFIQ